MLSAVQCDSLISLKGAFHNEGSIGASEISAVKKALQYLDLVEECSVQFIPLMRMFSESIYFEEAVKVVLILMFTASYLSIAVLQFAVLSTQSTLDFLSRYCSFHVLLQRVDSILKVEKNLLIYYSYDFYLHDDRNNY